MKLSGLLALVLLCGSTSLPGQNMISNSEPRSFATQDYAANWAYYKHLLKNDSMNSDLNYQMGICLLNSRSQKDKALPYLEKALRGNTSKPQAHKDLAAACHAAGQFDEAIQHYEAYRQQVIEQDGSAYLIRSIEQEIELCRADKELKHLKKLLKELMAARYSTTGTTGTPDTNSSSNQSSSPIPKSLSKELRYDQQFFDATSDADHPANAEYNLQDTARLAKEATVATSIDGQIMLTYHDDEGTGNLYLSMLEGNEWTTPDRVNKTANTSGWEPGEYVSPDGKTMYFTSSRPGGYGGKDIYKCAKLSTGEWSMAINLGPVINTPYDDEAPCILPDGVTLFFSSNRNKSKSNFDLYSSTFNDSGAWSKPVNVGYPVKKDSPLRKSIERAPEKDNYAVTFPSAHKIPITLLRGKLTDQDGKFPAYAEVTVIDNMSGEVAGVYHPDAEAGHYNLILPPGKNTNITIEARGYLFHSENIDLSADTGLYRVTAPTVMSPLAEKSSEVLNNVFFDANGTVVQPNSLPELNKLQRFLKTNPGCSVELGCAAITPESNPEQGKLAEVKARSVADFLVQKGIDKDRIVTHAFVSSKKKRRKRSKAPTLAARGSTKIEIKITDIR